MSEQMQLQAQKEQNHQMPNHTNIPTQMKLDFEKRSGLSFDDVRVHYHSDKPARIGALAYTQGNQVYIGPGQERHLRHELGHVVQQKQGLVRPTRISNGVAINDNPTMEQNADRGIFPAGTGIQHRAVVQRQLDYSDGNFRPSTFIFPYSEENEPRFGDSRVPSMTSTYAQVFLTKTRAETTYPTYLYDMEGWMNYLTQDGQSVNLLLDITVDKTLTRMHLINGHFFGPDEPQNMVLGPQGKNHIHYNKVERIISEFLNTKRNDDRAVNYMVCPRYGWFPPNLSTHLDSVRDYDALYYRQWVRSCCPKSLMCSVIFYKRDSNGQLFSTGIQYENISVNQ